MAKNVVLILEYGDGGYSCYNDEPLGNYGVIDGDGATAEEAKADFMKALQECREDDPNNKDLQDLTFTYKYDVQAFFKEFSFSQRYRDCQTCRHQPITHAPVCKWSQDRWRENIPTAQRLYGQY